MKRVVLLGILGALMPAWGMNISFVELQRVFNSHPDTKKAREILQKDIEKGSLEIKIREKEIISLQDELKKPLSEKAKIKKQTTIQAKIEDLQNYQQEITRVLTNKRKKLEEGINLKIRSIIKDIAKKKKIGLVIDKELVIYGKDSLDITDEVIRKIKETEGKKK